MSDGDDETVVIRGVSVRQDQEDAAAKTLKRAKEAWGSGRVRCQVPRRAAMDKSEINAIYMTDIGGMMRMRSPDT